MKLFRLSKILFVALILSVTVHAEDPQVDGAKKISQAQSLSAQANLKAIESAINNYRSMNERNPQTLQDLVTAGLLTEIPKAPDGQQFVYDASSGHVSVTGTATQSSLPSPTPENAMRMALDVQAKSNLKKITTALNVYMVEHEGQFPEKLEELVKSGMLDKLPAPPSGMKYAYDPKTGKVNYVSK